MIHVEMSERDIKLLLQSLTHCLETCKHKTSGHDEPCEDCDAAQDLKERLGRLLTGTPAGAKD
jgi:hypothetical protein